MLALTLCTYTVPYIPFGIALWHGAVLAWQGGVGQLCSTQCTGAQSHALLETMVFYGTCIHLV